MPRKPKRTGRKQGSNVWGTVEKVLGAIDKAANVGKKVHDSYLKAKQVNAKIEAANARRHRSEEPKRSPDEPLTYGLKAWRPESGN